MPHELPQPGESERVPAYIAGLTEAELRHAVNAPLPRIRAWAARELAQRTGQDAPAMSRQEPT